MKLASNKRPDFNNPTSLADLKLGMNSVNKSGVQQNTTCLFARCEFEPDNKNSSKDQENVDHRVECKGHCGYRKPVINQKNPYIERKCSKLNYFLEKCRRPLTNLSPYLKQAKNITDEEEKKILDLIEIFKKKVRSWDNYEEERFRRFLELQDPVFREKLLECMKEHIQETNLLDSFFIRYKHTHVPIRSKTQQQKKRAFDSKNSQVEAKKKVQENTQKNLVQEDRKTKDAPHDKVDAKIDKAKESTVKHGDIIEQKEVVPEHPETKKQEAKHMKHEDPLETSKADRSRKKKEVRVVSYHSSPDKDAKA